MANHFWQTVAETSWWFYLLILYILYISYCATKERIIHINFFYALPSLFFALSFIAVLTLIKMTLINASIWISTLLIGVLFGWIQFYVLKVKALKKEKKIYIPGTWSVFFFIILLSITKYYYSDHINFDLQQLLHGNYSSYLLSIYGIGTGLMIGRLIYSLRCLKLGPYYR